MSRSAALAYAVSDLADESSGRGGYTEQYRLLGLNQAGQRRSSANAKLTVLHRASDTGHYYPAITDEPPHIGFHLPEMHRARPGSRFSSPRSLVSLLLSIIVVIIVGLTALSAIPVRGNTLIVSGYRDLRAPVTAKPAVAAPPVLDATTAQTPVAAAKAESPPPPQPGAYSVLGPPSLSVQKIEAVLKQYGSPAAGQGQLLYDLGVKYGIDPAYALAFFVHESGAGTKGVARFTRSIGNIRWTEGYGNFEGYRSYQSWETGMEDWYKLITDLYIGGWGLRTVDAIIPVYAPWGDNNNPPGYIASVKAMVDSWRGK